MCSALGNVLGKFGVPYLTFPFNILAIVTFLTLQTIYPALPEKDTLTSSYNTTSNNVTSVEIEFVVNKKTTKIE